MLSTSTSRLLVSFVVGFLLIARDAALAAPLGDLIDNLPLYGRPPTPQFSGYLDATAGCDTSTNGDYCKLHYWLALAKHDPWKKPVVLWLNGGPGSSSIYGFLSENGPLLINATGGLMDNPWSWTNVANLMALEAPVGVGYSYCARQADGGEDPVCRNTDKFTASASRAAVVDFFGTKFPELADNDFFITGESYAGVYIPTLAKEILDHAAGQVNLVGIAVGDPCTDNTAQQDSMDSLWYGQKYGLLDDATFDLLWNKCEMRAPNLMTQGGKHLVAARLNEKLRAKKKELLASSSSGGQDTIDIELRDFARDLLAQLSSDPGPKFRNDEDDCRMAYRKFQLSTSKGLSQTWKDLYIDDYSLFSPVTNQPDDYMATYMMRPDVRRALHVEEAPTQTWPYFGGGFDYTSEYDACNWGIVEDSRSMIDFYRDIAPRLKVAWVYNGDTDPCVSYEGTRTALKRVGFEEIDGGGYRPWFFNQTRATLELLAEKTPVFGPGLLAADMGPQFGGEVVNYEHGLAFLTVHGSGHMVPQCRPQASLHMVDKLVHFAELAPLMPSNETLAKMSGKDFMDVMAQWVESAQAPPYVSEVTWLRNETESDPGGYSTAEK